MAEFVGDQRCRDHRAISASTWQAVGTWFQHFWLPGGNGFRERLSRPVRAPGGSDAWHTSEALSRAGSRGTPGRGSQGGGEKGGPPGGDAVVARWAGAPRSGGSRRVGIPIGGARYVYRVSDVFYCCY